MPDHPAGPAPAPEAIERTPDEAEGRAALRALVEEHGSGCPFGPMFFLTQLRGFVRDRCPDPAEALPSVELYVQPGETLEVCHVIALAPRWVALAVYDGKRPKGAMRTELVPYELIVRVTVRAVPPTEPSVGFRQGGEPGLVASAATPEDALRIAATAADRSQQPR